MRIIVLGAQGFVGSAFVRQAAREGIECLGVDLDNYDSCRGAQADLVINAAGNSKKYLAAREPSEDFRISLAGLLASFFDFKFDHYAYISSIDIYPDHSYPENNHESAPIEIGKISHYGFHKKLGELMVKHYLSSWLIIRLGGVLGPGLKKNPVYDLLHGLPLRVSPDSRYQYLETDFLALAVFELARRGYWGEIFNACGSGTISIREIAQLADRELSFPPEKSASELYEIDNSRLGEIVDIPATRRVVERFIRECAQENK